MADVAQGGPRNAQDVWVNTHEWKVRGDIASCLTRLKGHAEDNTSYGIFQVQGGK